MRRRLQAQPALFALAAAAAAPAIEQRRIQSRQAVRLYAPPAEPVAGAGQVVTAGPPKPQFDCWLHWPPVRSAWYLVQRRWTCGVCYPRLRD